VLRLPRPGRCVPYEGNRPFRQRKLLRGSRKRRDYDRNLDLAKKYEIPLEKGVPSLAVLDPDGKLVVSQKKGEFESTTRIAPKTSSNS